MPNKTGNPVIFEAMEMAVLDHFGGVPLNPLDALPVMEEAGEAAMKRYPAAPQRTLP